MLLGIMSTDSGDGLGLILVMGWDGLKKGYGKVLTHCLFVESNHKVFGNFSNCYSILRKEKHNYGMGSLPKCI